MRMEPLYWMRKAFTAFEGNGELYQFCRVPFAVPNRVAVFQHTINDIIYNNLKDTFAYVDNITIAETARAQSYFQ